MSCGVKTLKLRCPECSIVNKGNTTFGVDALADGHITAKDILQRLVRAAAPTNCATNRWDK